MRFRAYIGSFAAALAAVAALCALLPASALAQAAVVRTGYIDPFPRGDVYRVQVVGDWYADGLHGSILEALGKNPRVQVQRSVLQLRTLRRNDWDTHVTRLEEASKATPIDIAIVMFGASEIGSLNMPGRSRIRFGREAWKERYAARVDRIMKALKGRNGAVYWLGLPIVRRSNYNDGYQTINEIIRGRAYVNGIKYIDVYKGFADENGNYSRYGPDIDGKVQLLRNRDGNYFTPAGYKKLAYFAVREISRDLVRAQSERTVPLAGSEIEQRRINPDRFEQAKQKKPETDGQRKPVVRLGRAAGDSARREPRTGPLRLGRRNRDLAAEDGSVVITSIQGEQRVQTLKLKIVRPAISAAVIDLVTRKQAADQPSRMGDSVTLQLPGGGTLISSVTPAETSGFGRSRSKVSPTQSPFFKVWAKGERLPPRPGRADDSAWPPPEPEPVIRAVLKPAAARRSREEQRIESGLPPLPAPNPLGAAAHRARR